nr:hypothetical protein [Mycoplasmopsis bovis]
MKKNLKETKHLKKIKHLSENKTPGENKTPMREILRKARQTMALVEVKIIFEVRMKMFRKV